MPWLEPTVVLPLAGYSVPSPLEDTLEARALAYAEQLIAYYTQAVWGETVSDTLRVRLSARSFIIPLPLDITEVVELNPTTEPTIRTKYGLEYASQCVFEAGSYTLEVERGFTVIPEDVKKAASLLAAHYLGLSDPERSRYDNFMLGDFSGTQRRDAFPVPEAAQLLRRYRTNVGVAVA